jgi:hypothetical protein
MYLNWFTQKFGFRYFNQMWMENWSIHYVGWCWSEMKTLYKLEVGFSSSFFFLQNLSLFLNFGFGFWKIQIRVWVQILGSKIFKTWNFSNFLKLRKRPKFWPENRLNFKSFGSNYDQTKIFDSKPFWSIFFAWVSSRSDTIWKIGCGGFRVIYGGLKNFSV